VKIPVLPACTCSDGPDVGELKTTRTFNEGTQRWYSKSEMVILPGVNRMPDGSIIPHYHLSMIKRCEELRRIALGQQKAEAPLPKQMKIGEEGWDAAEYENQIGT
jgi:hypothetical protein